MSANFLLTFPKHGAILISVPKRDNYAEKGNRQECDIYETG